MFHTVEDMTFVFSFREEKLTNKNQVGLEYVGKILHLYSITYKVLLSTFITF